MDPERGVEEQDVGQGGDAEGDDDGPREDADPVDGRLISAGSMIVVGLPSEMISARPEAADSVPRVTMKSVIPPLRSAAR